MNDPLRDSFAADEVLNQPPALENYNVYTSDRVLQEAVAREGGGWAAAELAAFGAALGSAAAIEEGRLANAYPPVLKSFDRFGHRQDLVEFHPAWHATMARAVAAGVHAAPWAEPKPGAHVARAAGVVMQCQPTKRGVSRLGRSVLRIHSGITYGEPGASATGVGAVPAGMSGSRGGIAPTPVADASGSLK